MSYNFTYIHKINAQPHLLAHVWKWKCGKQTRHIIVSELFSNIYIIFSRQMHVESKNSRASNFIGQSITLIVFWPIKSQLIRSTDFLTSHFRFISSCQNKCICTFFAQNIKLVKFTCYFIYWFEEMRCSPQGKWTLRSFLICKYFPSMTKELLRYLIVLNCY